MNYRLITGIIVTTLGCMSTASAQDCADVAALRLIVDKYHLRLNDKRPICITVPGKFKIKIKQPAGASVTVNAGDVTVTEKTGSALDIEGDNAAVANKVRVEVDGPALVEEEFDFWIKVEGVGELDPRVRVIDNDSLNQVKKKLIDDLFDTLVTTPEEYMEFREKYE